MPEEEELADSAFSVHQFYDQSPQEFIYLM